MNKVVRVLVFLFLLITGLLLKSAERPMHEIHSMLMFNFIKYVEWPAEAKSGDFVIAVMGDTEVVKTLHSYYALKPIKGQSVKIIDFQNINVVNSAHVVYLADDASKDFEAIKSKFAGRPTLLITDKAGLGKKGSCINFSEVDGKLKFEINQAAVAKNKLKVSNQLSSMGILL